MILKGGRCGVICSCGVMDRHVLTKQRAVRVFGVFDLVTNISNDSQRGCQNLH
jgi:hypothetical protein